MNKEKFHQIVVVFKDEDYKRLEDFSDRFGLTVSKSVRNLTLDNLEDVSLLLKFCSPFLKMGSTKK